MHRGSSDRHDVWIPSRSDAIALQEKRQIWEEHLTIVAAHYPKNLRSDLTNIETTTMLLYEVTPVYCCKK